METTICSHFVSDVGEAPLISVLELRTVVRVGQTVVLPRQISLHLPEGVLRILIQNRLISDIFGQFDRFPEGDWNLGRTPDLKKWEQYDSTMGW